MAHIKKLSKIHQRVNDKSRLSLDELQAMPKNTFWDDAKSFYDQGVEAILMVEGQLRDILVHFVKDSVKVTMIPDQKGFANNINILTKDIAEHFERLNNIYKKHSDKSGGTVSPDEHMALLQIHGEYAEALEIYNANILPIAASITEQISLVEQQLLQQQMVTDVNVITDVQVKETTGV